MKPRAWAVFAENGNVRLWSQDRDEVRKFAEKTGYKLVPLYSIESAPVAIMDTRDGLGVCALAEDDFPALYALKSHRVALIDMGPNAALEPPANTKRTEGDRT